MYLIANGCSHTSGAEIEYVLQDSCYSKAWPQHLANKLNLESINLARSGASSKRVVRTTLEHIGTLFLKGVKPEQLFVIISWPGPYRTEIYKGAYIDDPIWQGWLPMCPNNDASYKKIYPRDVYYYYKAWVTTLDGTSANIDYYNHVILLQSYLKSFKIKYLFWRASFTTLNKENLPLAIQIDRKYFPCVHDDSLDYLSLLKHSGFKFPFKNSTHHGEDGHIFFANYLYNYINDNSLWSL